ncbi:hypothetical protein OAK51_06345 [Alphaproteobacteria bacterium]|nr:hypothetical protein [Alphaproteobacteria bacterium]
MKYNKISNDSCSVRWVIALKEEAKTILVRYKMKLISNKTLYPIFKNNEETHWLVLSGIGRHNSAAATSYLYTISKASKWTSWINLGIAGCGKGNYGDLCLVDKIVNNSSQITYPTTIPKTNLHRMELLTTDVPITDYANQELIDMEGTAFYDIASKLTSRELICIMKVISDGPSNNINDLNKLKINQLIKSNISKINKVVLYFEKLSLHEDKIRKKPELFHNICSKWHFSTTQMHQLENLTRRLIIFSDKDDIMELIKGYKNSSSVITFLKSKINSNEINWSKF